MRVRALRLIFFAAVSVHAASSIEFTSIPAYGTTSNLFGKVYGVDPASYRVAVFISAPGAGWYTKPTCASPLTTIAADGTWTANITTGANDQNATQIAAFVVPASFTSTCVLGDPCLTNAATQQAVASTLATRVDPVRRSFHWSGYDWWVKSSTGKVGPGPNYFSDTTNNVAVDTQGRLHLRITKVANKWYCAEIVSQRTLGLGRYVFNLNSPVDALDSHVTLGLFTWSDQAAFNNREIDIECARWGNAADTNNSQFVVQPYDQSNHLIRYLTILTNSTHSFNWHSTNVVFTSDSSTWAATNGIPPSCDENIRLNLWLFQGNAPAEETEVIVEKFTFISPDADGDGMPDDWERAHNLTDPNADEDGDGFTNLQEFLAGTDPANVANALQITTVNHIGPDNRVTFSTAQDKVYAVEYKDKLDATIWTPLPPNVTGTGNLVSVIDTGAALQPSRFYRVRLLP